MCRNSTQQPSIILLFISAFLTFVSEVAADGKEIMVSFFSSKRLLVFFISFAVVIYDFVVVGD